MDLIGRYAKASVRVALAAAGRRRGAMNERFTSMPANHRTVRP